MSCSTIYRFRIAPTFEGLPARASPAFASSTGCSTPSSTARSPGNSGRVNRNEATPRSHASRRRSGIGYSRPTRSRQDEAADSEGGQNATIAGGERGGGSQARPVAVPLRPAHGGARYGELQHAAGPEKG